MSFRADAMMQLYWINLYTFEADNFDMTITENLGGIRWGLAAGIEL